MYIDRRKEFVITALRNSAATDDAYQRLALDVVCQCVMDIGSKSKKRGPDSEYCIMMGGLDLWLQCIDVPFGYLMLLLSEVNLIPSNHPASVV